MLDRINQEIVSRSAIFRNAAAGGIPAADLEEFNRLTGNAMPRVWLIVDEANTFLAAKPLQERLADPARIGRKFGVHIVLAGHDWHEYTVNRGLTSFFETRLCLRTSNDTTGRIVLDDTMRGKRTMNFRQPGRGILRLRGQYQDVQLYNVSPDQEREWFAQVKPSDERMQWLADQAEAKGETLFIEPTADIDAETTRIIDLSMQGKSEAEIIRTIWNVNGGGSYYRRQTQVRAALASKVTSSSSDNPIFGSEMGLQGA
jgi:DNA segregation ATPase FtsK/SpoIIIE-like protein